MSFTPPTSFSEKLKLPSLKRIIRDLNQKEGRDFEKTVCTAFNFLDFDASLTQSTQSESDVIAEAYYAEKPYFIVIECQAVRPQNQVGVDKVGQIRGNAQAYSLNPRRQRLFETSHKLIVGRPAFSDDARRRAPPDVGLITTTNLSRLLLHHKQLSYSQDELVEVLGVPGEISSSGVEAFQRKILSRRQHDRKLDIYSLIYIALLENPYSDDFEKRKNRASVDIVIGSVLTFGGLFQIPNLIREEIAEAIRDLDNPFLRMLRKRINEQGQVEVRLSTISRPVVQTSSEFGKMLSNRIESNIQKLRTLMTTTRPGSQ